MTAVADTQPSKTSILLLVEDNRADAELISALLDESARERYEVIHVLTLTAALERLKSASVDVVVLDVRLPDAEGVDCIKRIRERAPQLPIVVLTGVEDEAFALTCVHAGAQDYLTKGELGSANLRRAIGYALTRTREAKIRQLQEMLERYRSLSSATQPTSVTAALAGSGAVALRSPETFERIGDEYFALLEPYLSRRVERIQAPRDAMERIVTALGDSNGGPRDLLDVHVAAMERAIAACGNLGASSIAFEGRLFALEMMGLLVDYYRVGQRRRFLEGART